VTGRDVIYLECTVMSEVWLPAARSDELVELRWLYRDQVEDLVPDLPHVVRCYLQRRYLLHSSGD